MSNTCIAHQEICLAVCQNKQCNHSLHCLRCIQLHNQEHNSDAIEIFKLENNETWTKDKEVQKQEQIQQIQNALAQKEGSVSQIKTFLNTVLDEVVQAEGFGKLDEILKTNQSLNFEQGDVFVKLSHARTLNENSSKITGQIEATKFFLEEMKIDDSQMPAKREQAVIFLKKLLWNIEPPKQTSKEEKDLKKLQEKYEKEKKDNENKIKELQKQINQLKNANKHPQKEENKPIAPKVENKPAQKEEQKPPLKQENKPPQQEENKPAPKVDNKPVQKEEAQKPKEKEKVEEKQNEKKEIAVAEQKAVEKRNANVQEKPNPKEVAAVLKDAPQEQVEKKEQVQVVN